MKHIKGAGDEQVPEARKLTDRQLARLSELSGVATEELTEHTVAQLRDKFGSLLSHWLFFRKVCGRVVKKDPVTGELLGVPFATVEVEDTDCNLISFHPGGFEFGWFFPFRCRREVIATTTTDACGNFCVWVPRFDIDYVLRWRHHRYCFPEIFKRPNLQDLLPKLVVEPTFPPRDPGDPAPYLDLSRTQLQALAGPAGERLSDRLDRISTTRAFGGYVEDVEADLHARAFDAELQPPLPVEFHRALGGIVDVATAGKRADPVAAVRSAVALKLGLEADDIADFQPTRFIGPFWRCIDVITPEWDLIIDVPDITFKVLQDVNGDGTPETIYSEGYFDVRWDAGTIPPVTLLANDLAIASRDCHTPDVVCSDVPEISFAGLMPLHNGLYFDATTGYALRPDRPANGDGSVTPTAADHTRPPAQTPLADWVSLFGCVDIEGAAYYRVEQRAEGQLNFVPIVGQARGVWDLSTNSPADVSPPIDGWYPILRPAAQFHPANLLVPVPPGNGRQEFRVQVADGAKNPIGTYSSIVAIQMDNTAPRIVPTKLAWKFAGEPETAFDGPGRDLLVNCPTIHRGSAPSDIVVRFEVTTFATHLRDTAISTFGCGGLLNAFSPSGSSDVTQHWHTSALDNTVALHGRYTLDAIAQEGSYGFTAVARSRAINPDDEPAELALWYSDDFAIWSQSTWNVAVVNSNG